MTNDPGSGGPPAGSAPREIGILAVTGFELLDLAGPLSLFASATWDGSNDGRPAYRCRVIGLERGPVAASIGTTLFADTALAGLEPGGFDTVLVAGGVSAREPRPDPPILDWLRRAAHRVRRIGSVRTGEFLLAGAGVLDGRVVTTH